MIYVVKKSVQNNGLYEIRYADNFPEVIRRLRQLGLPAEVMVTPENPTYITEEFVYIVFTDRPSFLLDFLTRHERP